MAQALDLIGAVLVPQGKLRSKGGDRMVKINGEFLDMAGKTLAEYLSATQYDPKRIALEKTARKGSIVAVCGLGGRKRCLHHERADAM